MEKIHLYDKILTPVVTEKSTNLSELNKIVFKVPDGANKKNLKKNIEKIFKKHNELQIAYAVLEIFRNSDRIENFNKKALYLYIREMTNCKTQNITKVVNKMKDMQKKIQIEYKETGDVKNEH